MVSSLTTRILHCSQLVKSLLSPRYKFVPEAKVNWPGYLTGLTR